MQTFTEQKKESDSVNHDIDAELERILQNQKAKIKVVGTGGAGNNTINRITEVGIHGAETIAINTDAQDLLYCNADSKILIGKEITGGLGAGSIPQVGEEAAKESEHEIKRKLQGADMVFITCGMGGGCLRSTSLVYTNPKGLIPIKSIQSGDKVYTFSNGKLTKNKVIASMKTGIKKVLELKTKNKKIYASYDHPFLKLDNKDIKWTELKNLHKNDLLLVLKLPKSNINSHNLIYSNLFYNGNKVTPDLFKEFEFDKITSIKEIGNEEVYDITVEGSHNFISEGLVVHNTGTGSAPIIAEVTKKLGALTVAIVTVPFSMEGARRIENAQLGLEKLESYVDTLIVIPNDKLLELAPDLPLQTAFKVADEILTNSVKGIAELVTKAGLVNLDFADIRTVMGNGGVSLIGIGESDTENRAIEAVQKAINNPLLDVDISGANGALINVAGGSDLTLEEARKVVETVTDKIAPEARVIWGAQISDDLVNTLRVMLIVTGVSSPQIFGSKRKLAQIKQKKIESELGIEFIK